MFGFWNRARSASLSVISAATSECGPNRKKNEDGFHASDTQRAYCVADGVGGGCEGEKASQIVCRELRMMMNAVGNDYPSRVQAAVRSLTDANQAIHAYAADHGYAQMGSTVALMLFDLADASRATVVHVGDSRVYRIRSGLATVLTRDHSVGFELGDFAGGRAQEFRDRANPLAHVLTRAIGTKAEVRPEVREVEVRRGDRFVLCTDGVHDVIPDARLGVYAGSGALAAARDRLAAEVLKAGAPDNYTLVLVEVR